MANQSLETVDLGPEAMDYNFMPQGGVPASHVMTGERREITFFLGGGGEGG